ncbi:MAG TPA: DUF928 domain-containing protein [Nitrospirales bacterium]|jgi:hypothetical protein
MRYLTTVGSIILFFALALPEGNGAEEASVQFPDVKAEVSATAINPAMPLYNPPKGSAAGGRFSDSSARGNHDIPTLMVLAPNHIGLTKNRQPTLYWYLSRPTTYSIEFTLVDSREIAPLLEIRLNSPTGAGIHAIRLSDYGISLAPGVPYRWFVTVMRDREPSSRDVVTGAVVERVDYVEALYLTEAGHGDEVHRYADAGLWYDAIHEICSLIQAHPQEQIYRLQRASLLEQVGLSEIANYDSKQ